jgi:hypothetical protein
VNWGQAHIWREISRYEMRKELEISQDYSHGVNQFSIATDSGKSHNLSHIEEVSYIYKFERFFLAFPGSS